MQITLTGLASIAWAGLPAAWAPSCANGSIFDAVRFQTVRP